jgi:hypothetical protein
MYKLYDNNEAILKIIYVDKEERRDKEREK